MSGVSEQKVAADLHEVERPDGVIYPPDGWGLCNYLEHLKVINKLEAAAAIAAIEADSCEEPSISDPNPLRRKIATAQAFTAIRIEGAIRSLIEKD